MEETSKKRWSVTYTKHIKQKRKVYQDGFLELHISTNKVKLFDECENLLECRVLKNTEVVSPGETLTFHAYLVDVGDPEGAHTSIPASNLNLQKNEKKFVRPPGVMNRQKFQSPVSSETGKDTAEKKKYGRLHNLSPSQRIIKDFKMSEMQKHGILQGGTNTARPEKTEWQALYTTQVTQKAKKYQDGFIHLAGDGTLGRQVLLYDENKNLLNSRFLKKDEIIKPGESLALDGHLVEIGEPVGNIKTLVDLDLQMKDSNILRSKKAVHADLENSSEKEWQVMYTTQTSQKARKYHDGILRLANCGSLRRKITLLGEDNTILCSKFLGSSEEVRSGSTILLPKYLVDVGDPRKNALSSKVADSNISICQTKENIASKTCEIKVTEQLTNMRSEENVYSSSSSSAAWAEFGNTNQSAKSLRDARQILSILQRPTAQQTDFGHCKDKVFTVPASSTKAISELNVDVAYPEVSRLPGELPPSYNGCAESGDLETGKALDFNSSKAMSSAGIDELSEVTEDLDSNQPFVNTPLHESFSSASRHNLYVDQGKSFDQPKSTTKMDDCPTFDLGF